MANSVTFQTLLDGPRNVVVKIVGILDTSDLASTPAVDPALLAPFDPWGNKARQLRIDRIYFNVEDGLDVKLHWDATVPVIIDTMCGRGKLPAWDYGGLINNAGAGKTGKILISTQGWTTGQLEFTCILEMIKQ